MLNFTQSGLKWAWIIPLTIIIDQLSKLWVSSTMQLGEHIPVVSGLFDVVLAHNTGAAFSFLSNAGGWQRWFFILLAVVVSAVLLVWLSRLTLKDRWTAICLSLIVGGALGNVIDRTYLGYVVDFLYFYQGSWSWPAFNIADSAISLGAVGLISLNLFAPTATTESEKVG